MWMDILSTSVDIRGAVKLFATIAGIRSDAF